jgi:hypothetical protein
MMRCSLVKEGLLALVLAAAGLAPASAVEPEAPMAITVVPRSDSGVFRDTALVYLDGRIDPGAPERLSRVLDGVGGKIAVWLNSPGGNLFAGMQLGRIIRQHGASTHIIDHRTLRPGECYSACSLTFLGGVYRFNDNAGRYGVHRASLGPGPDDVDRGQDFSSAVGSYLREMGVDTRLLDLWQKARPDEMYVLSGREAEDLGVVNNGRTPPEWRIAAGAGRHRRNGDGVLFLRRQADRPRFELRRSGQGRRAPRPARLESLADDRRIHRGSCHAASDHGRRRRRPLDVRPDARSGASRAGRQADRSSTEAAG